MNVQDPMNIELAVFDQVELDDYYRTGEFPENLEGRFTAESFAMLGALKSRSGEGVLKDLDKVRKRGAEHFMETYYKKYGHLSIGQNSGVVGIYIEGCSMIAAKIIQDDLHYNGQETSTRYLTFAESPVFLPECENGDMDSAVYGLVKEGKELYADIQAPIFNHLKAHTPMPEGGDPKVWDKTLKARTFDITRSLLPAGTTTLVAWHGLIETLCRRVPVLQAHPLPEVSIIGDRLMEMLVGKYPSSFAVPQTNDAIARNEDKLDHLMNESMIVDRDVVRLLPERMQNNAVFNVTDYDHFRVVVDDKFIREKFLCDRMRKMPLPRTVGSMVDITFYPVMDFGSWRDLQRHRMGGAFAEILTPRRGFHKWYLAQMPEAIKEKVEAYLEKVSALYEEYEDHMDELEFQYIVPMGFKLQAILNGDLRQMTYMCELRSGLTVHPTARYTAIGLGKAINIFLKDNFDLDPVVRLCMDEDTLTLKRGQQDIDGIREED